MIETGKQYCVRDFVNAAAQELEIRIDWQGKGIDEKGYDKDGKCIVSIDPRYFRPTEVDSLLGDASKAREKLGWVPKTTFEELVTEMVREDFEAAEREELIKKHGYTTPNYFE